MTPETLRVAILSIISFTALVFVFCLVECRFNIRRLLLLLKTEWHIVTDQAFAKRVAGLFVTVAKEEKEKKPTAEPLRLLALLQREGRLVDFLLEDIQGATDEQIGAGVRGLPPWWQSVPHFP